MRGASHYGCCVAVVGLMRKLIGAAGFSLWTAHILCSSKAQTQRRSVKLSSPGLNISILGMPLGQTD